MKILLTIKINNKIMTRKNENLTVGANNYSPLQNEKFLNHDSNKINKISKIFNFTNLGNPENLAKITVQKTKNHNTTKPHCSKNTTLSGG